MSILNLQILNSNKKYTTSIFNHLQIVSEAIHEKDKK